MKIRPLVLVGLGLSLCNAASQAAILNATELPDSIESCWLSGSCSVGNQSIHDVNGISAFHYQNSGFAGYLFRYQLKQPSSALDAWQQTDFSSDPPTIHSYNSNSHLTGNVWLQVAERYDSQDVYHGVTLYLENVQPSNLAVLPRIGADVFPKTLNFGFSNSALQNAHADKSIQLNDFSSTESGDLQVNEMPLVCISAGCGIELQFNLIGMRFGLEGKDWVTQFTEDSRALLYSERMYFNGIEQTSNNQRSFYVQRVPLVPSGWLMFTGLATLYAGRKKRNHQLHPKKCWME